MGFHRSSKRQGYAGCAQVAGVIERLALARIFRQVSLLACSKNLCHAHREAMLERSVAPPILIHRAAIGVVGPSLRLLRFADRQRTQP